MIIIFIIIIIIIIKIIKNKWLMYLQPMFEGVLFLKFNINGPTGHD